MSSFRVLLFTLALTLLGITVESWSGSSGSRNHNYDLSGRDLTNLYNSRVKKAERVVRPLWNFKRPRGKLSHSGVRVTLEDGSKWLIHKGANNGISSQTVVVNDKHMSTRWRSRESRDFNGQKTVADFVRVGGEKYKLIGANCHDATNAMMGQ